MKMRREMDNNTNNIIKTMPMGIRVNNKGIIDVNVVKFG